MWWTCRVFPQRSQEMGSYSFQSDPCGETVWCLLAMTVEIITVCVREVERLLNDPLPPGWLFVCTRLLNHIYISYMSLMENIESTSCWFRSISVTQNRLNQSEYQRLPRQPVMQTSLLFSCYTCCILQEIECLTGALLLGCCHFLWCQA